MVIMRQSGQLLHAVGGHMGPRQHVNIPMSGMLSGQPLCGWWGRGSTCTSLALTAGYYPVVQGSGSAAWLGTDDAVRTAVLCRREAGTAHEHRPCRQHSRSAHAVTGHSAAQPVCTDVAVRAAVHSGASVAQVSRGCGVSVLVPGHSMYCNVRSHSEAWQGQPLG
jgi:hypothetical protein